MQEENRYLQKLDKTIKEYFKILSNEFPEFLFDYINTPVMQNQANISVSCGTYYSKMFNQIWYSSLDHSVAVALIIWNFTKDKKQTLSGLFHDIATPVFKHSIDFMNKDYEKQESTEELTTKKIISSKEIMQLLSRDNIKVEEVCDYHIYPIADNDTPMLSSDRLEYTLSNALGATEKLWGLEEIKKIYKNIEVQENENGIIELGFKDKEIAEQFVHTMSILSCLYRRNKTIFSMQFLADILKLMSEKNLITVDDLYSMSEADIIDKIRKCSEGNISQCFEIWENSNETEIHTSETCPSGVYYVHIPKNKVRYINPLVRQNNSFVRLKDVSVYASECIRKTFDFKGSEYVYMDFAINYKNK